MASPAPVPNKIRFDTFEMDATSGELRKSGILLKLQPQPFRVLLLLIERAGQVVTREEIQRCLWTDSTFVDFEHGINFSVNQIRGALTDSAENPRYVETIPRRGYRFIGTVARKNGEPPAQEPHTQDAIDDPAKTTTSPPRRGPRRVYTMALGGAAILAILIPIAARSMRGHMKSSSAAATIKSLAVLPLANLSGDPEQDYFVDGMTDAVITDLGQVRALRVISRTSAMRYKGANKSLQEIARDLNVDALVEGTVTRSADRVRITANLLQVSPEKHLWAQTYERDVRDVVALQDEIARGIAQEIRVQLAPEERSLLGSTRRVNPEAYELYLHGHYFLTRGYRAALMKSGSYFDQAITKDPTYAPAYVGLANFYTVEGRWSKANAAAERAVEIDETLAEAHSAVGDILLDRNWDFAGAERELKRALELDPNSADAHKSYAFYLLYAGQLDRAIQEVRWALEIDPLRLDLSNDLGRLFVFARRYDEAIHQFRGSLELDPSSTMAHCWIASSYEGKGMYGEAAAEYVKYLNLAGMKRRGEEFERIYSTQGYRAAARFDDRQTILQGPKAPFQDYWDIACSQARLHETDEAFRSLQLAYAERTPGLLQIRVDPDVDSLHSDPRYAELVRRIGFPQ
jgi:TolB-like protein/DNA-binding winged helix-turn-helix (wHTH) protein/Flp pilus assembly protein TadD